MFSGVVFTCSREPPVCAQTGVFNHVIGFISRAELKICSAEMPPEQRTLHVAWRVCPTRHSAAGDLMIAK